jgi:ArpU family phage transcriptional regulator
MINKELFNKMKPFVERKLKDYPFYLISIETPGLGAAIRPDIIIDKSMSPSDPVAKSVIDDEYKRTIVTAVGYVFDRLNNDSKTIVEYAYFRDDKTREEIMEELKVSKNTYYKLKNNALYKFMIGLGCF